MSAFADRADIAVGIESGLSDTGIADKIDRDRTVVWRARRRNGTKTRGYRPLRDDYCEAERRRRRPQQFRIDTDQVLTARVQADLRRSRTPRQTAGRLRSEARDTTVEPMAHSTDADGRTVSHEAIYRWIYALPEGELAKAQSLCGPSEPNARSASRTGSAGAGASSPWCRSTTAQTMPPTGGCPNE